MISKQREAYRITNSECDKVNYELTESEVLNLYYSEPRLAVLMDLDVIRLIDRHLVVNLKEFITPKTNHLTAHARRHISNCCVGIHYINEFESQPLSVTINGAYRYLYTVLYKGTIEECNVYLRSQKLQEFKLREKMA